MALFVASDQPLPAVPWSESARGFHVQDLTVHETSARRQFTKPYVYYLGAHTFCSCGFAYGEREAVTEQEKQEDAAARKSVADLRRYLRDAVERLGEVELFSSWEGDWNEEPLERLAVSPEWFGGDRFAMPERVAFRVRAAAGRA